MRPSVFISSTGNDVARATRGADGSWAIDLRLRNKGVCCLAAASTDTDLLFAGTNNNGVYRSSDNGNTWKASGLQDLSVKSLAVSPHDPNTVYAGSKPARLFVSRDGGDSWSESESFRRIPNRWWWFSPAEPPDLRPYVFAIAPSPTDPVVLLAGVEFGGVVRSNDGGVSWSRHRSGALRDCHSLKFHAIDGDWVYEAGGTGGGAAVSTDAGSSFQKAKHGLEKHYGIVCAADPAQPEIWYVSVAPGPSNAFGRTPEIYLYRRSTRDGWHSIGWTKDGRVPAAITALVTIPEEPGHLYAGLSNGDVWHTADYGDTWACMPFNLTGIWHSLLVI